MAAESSVIPLFPLHTVLFPGGPLPLRIFETRYTDMVRRCMRAGEPFGVVLIQEGREAGEVATVTVEERAALVSVERAAVVRLPTEAEVWPGVVMARGGSWVWDRKLSRCNLV
jgi:Lon protease-like protein